LVLGPVEARLAGASVDLGTPKQRALLCALALSLGRPVAVDTIVDLLWGDDAPPGVTGTLQSYVSNLRRVLEPRRERRRPAETLVTVAPGYALRLEPGATDAGRFVALVGGQHRLLAGVPLTGTVALPRDVLAEAVETLDQALGLWRGRPYAELDDAPDAVAERARLDDLRLVALEDRAVAALALGHHATVAAELEALTTAHPLRERMWGLRAVALARSGRQADALEALGSVRTVLSEELGLEPGIELRELQTAILRQDPVLTWSEPPSGPRSGPGPHPSVPPSPRADPAARPAAAPAAVGQVAPLVGRDAEMGALRTLLARAESGTASCALLVGEPGIGKSRLAAELARHARERDFTVLLGRCSPDEGAPPLWPWTAVLEGLGKELPRIEAAAGDDGARFRAWEEISRLVRDAARERPILLVVDDLHWADVSSLGALRVLIDAMSDERLLVVGTRRTHPEPEGPLADVGETAARRHAVRLDLAGLGVEDAAAVAQQVIGMRPSDRVSADLRDRTEGNPFFIVEYARLAGPRGDLRSLLDEKDPPTAVQDVLGRRISRLPEETVTALRVAAVIGRRFEAPTLARATGIDEDDLLDVVEPAQAAGLVRDDGIDRYAFGHALVVDTLLSGIRPSRLARIHARVAQALPPGPGHESELARHWLAAGPSYAAQAWRAAMAAAEQSSALHDHERASRLLTAARERLDQDDSATLRDRYDVLLALVDAHRWTAMGPQLVATAEEAIAVAEAIGDVTLLARAAISTTHGVLWQSGPYGEVHGGVIAALERCLVELPADDVTNRCRVLLGLAIELYYGSPYERRAALVTEALALAEEADDPVLQLEAHQAACIALWSPRNATERLAHAEAGHALALRLGDERAAVVTGCLRCVQYSETGRPADMWAEYAGVRAEAERLRLPFGMIVLDVLVLPWLAMAGRFEECEELLAGIQRLDAQMSLEQAGDAVASAMLSLARWQDRTGDVVPIFQEMAAGPYPVNASVAAMMWHAGREDEARAWLETHPPELDHDNWFTSLAWAHSAEVAVFTGDAALGARVAALLEPFVGESVRCGSAVASGPVDLYLALALAAAGDDRAATRHADRAAELCKDWEIPLVGDWLAQVRTDHGF
jgi:DNA-binding SARP family transcriptional activator